MSILNLEKNFVFIHVPKTAGTSIEYVDWIGSSIDKHGTLDDLYDFTDKTPEIDMNNMFKFGFVRDPFTRFMSGVVNHVFNSDITDAEITKFILEEVNFDKFVVLKQQNKFLTSQRGRKHIDFIGRFENLQNDFNHVCRILGQPETPLGHQMQGHEVDYNALYTPETREKVINYYKKDFELFGYAYD